MNKKVKRYFFSINTLLLFLLISAIITILLMDVVFEETPASSRLIYISGVIVHKICLSYCASFIFYVLTIYIPNKRRKLSLYKYLNNKLFMIYNIQQEFLNSIITGSIFSSNNCTKVYNLEKDEFKKCCKNINPNTTMIFYSKTGSMKFSNWFELFNFIHNNIKSNIDDLLMFEDALSIEIIMLLTDIEDLFSQHINITKGNPLANTDMNIYLESLWDFHSKTMEILTRFKNDNVIISKKWDSLYKKIREMNN